MSSKPVSKALQIWHQWKALRLPWRRRLFVGRDLEGNTYWTFHVAGTPSTSWRRIVDYPRATHLSEVKVPPMWHSWLRYTRSEPPTMEEQVAEAARRERMKVLAAQADRRWEAKPRIMGDVRPPPEKAVRRPLHPSVPSVEGPGGMGAPGSSAAAGARAGGEVAGGPADGKAGGEKEDPWAAANARDKEWKPEAWNPTPAPKK